MIVQKGGGVNFSEFEITGCGSATILTCGSMQDAVPVQKMRMKSDVHQRGGPWKTLDCLSVRDEIIA